MALLNESALIHLFLVCVFECPSVCPMAAEMISKVQAIPERKSNQQYNVHKEVNRTDVTRVTDKGHLKMNNEKKV